MSFGDLRFYDDEVYPGALAKWKRLCSRHSELEEFVNRDHTTSHRFDIPCVACSSLTGNRNYIDRHVQLIRPLKRGRTTIQVNISRFLIMGHERPEKALLIVFPDMPYVDPDNPLNSRHHLATAVEAEMVENAGFDWGSYRKELRRDIKADAHERIDLCPPDMDTSPIDDQPTLLRRVHEAMSRAKRSGKHMFGRRE